MVVLIVVAVECRAWIGLKDKYYDKAFVHCAYIHRNRLHFLHILHTNKKTKNEIKQNASVKWVFFLISWVWYVICVFIWFRSIGRVARAREQHQTVCMIVFFLSFVHSVSFNRNILSFVAFCYAMCMLNAHGLLLAFISLLWPIVHFMIIIYEFDRSSDCFHFFFCALW